MERISKAVFESRPLARTALDILSGFSSTALCESEEPMALTMPSPTRATMVSSVAPPTSWAMLVLTVTRARAISWMPSMATASMESLRPPRMGQSMTRGLTDVLTASTMSRPARSMAQHCANSSLMFARAAAIIARTTFSTLPPASRCAPSALWDMDTPPWCAMTSDLTRTGTFPRAR